MRDVYTRHQTDMTAARQALAAQPAVGGARPPSRPRALRPCLAPALRGVCGRCHWPRGQAWLRRDAGAALATVARSQAEPLPAVGLGGEYCLGALRLAHLMVFPAAEAADVSAAGSESIRTHGPAD